MVVSRLLRCDSWQLEKSCGWGMGKGNTQKKRDGNRKNGDASVYTGRWHVENKLRLLCVCVFRSEGTICSALWSIQPLGDWATLHKPGNQRWMCVCVCMCDCGVGMLLSFLFWTLNNLPRPAQFFPTSMIRLCLCSLSCSCVCASPASTASCDAHHISTVISSA